MIKRKWQHKVTYSGRTIIKRCKNFDIINYKINSNELSGKKILFFSDLHINNSNFNEIELSTEINSLNADWIIFGGDLLTFLYYHSKAYIFLKSLKAISGKITVLGNWENRRSLWIPTSIWHKYYSSSEFCLLSNSSLYADKITFTGLLPDLYDFNILKNNFSQNKFNCLISHKPDDAISFVKGKEHNYDLIFCGHTHGGQIRIPGFGALITASKYWKLFEYGHYINTKTGSNLIITGGLGYTGIRKRFFCRPEIVLINFC